MGVQERGEPGRGHHQRPDVVERLTVADRSRRPSTALSQTRSPGPRTASTTTRPSSPAEVTFAQPDSMMMMWSESSP